MVVLWFTYCGQDWHLLYHACPVVYLPWAGLVPFKPCLPFGLSSVGRVCAFYTIPALWSTSYGQAWGLLYHACPVFYLLWAGLVPFILALPCGLPPMCRIGTFYTMPALWSTYHVQGWFPLNHACLLVYLVWAGLVPFILGLPCGLPPMGRIGAYYTMPALWSTSYGQAWCLLYHACPVVYLLWAGLVPFIPCLPCDRSTCG